MSHIVRAARPGDLDAIYKMAKSTGGGFTNLPPNRPTLEAKLERAASCFARTGDEVGDEMFLFMLEDTRTGKVTGTCQVFSQVGMSWPFYSYRIGAITQHSKELGRTFRAETLSLVTDLEGSSEVGGLFLLPGERASGIGKLLARSRYLFIRNHRARFGDRLIAELRGAHDELGNSPFWDGVAGRFFGMSFAEADDFNAIHGNQFIADLMPKHPIYTAMIDENALAVMGVPHASGRAAMRMLENEGFVFDNYIDIFDGGPTMVAQTDRINTIRETRDVPVTRVGDIGENAPALLAAGRLAEFRACHAGIVEEGEGIAIDAATAAMLRVSEGDSVAVASR
ncbi:arginine N-succinyltransferase [Novosphingobium marinum]|uniref:Arginine N-succinyltransferase n=1 Tax=Novosphingobium marinum TaxID=1514948 RepID=A0A7Y9XUL0_9SPHN|nr:arginine N-succinyltransferase [Novosphingobium marinum]NYH94797.1 arginine N-succinyltransferase [Novosphingobium marinum]GGC37253.1 arginine N-succinyltransferase [Novosphingobium marinum]